MIPDRDFAWRLLLEYNESDALIKHALAVESVMVYFAKLFSEDTEKWGVVGLIHDLDYEKFPDEHCKKSAEILKEKNIDDEMIRAVVSHGYGICSDVKPESLMEKTLFTIDELTGLVHAAAIMRPSKSVMDLELKSLKKKFKTKAFAAGVNREVIEKGAAMLDMSLDSVMEHTILAMREAADAIGLRGAL